MLCTQVILFCLYFSNLGVTHRKISFLTDPKGKNMSKCEYYKKISTNVSLTVIRVVCTPLAVMTFGVPL